ncbi:unnamed protein product [Symbiodinium sp. CCMP2592]|nr:unnamed protein product [Symbiodinium sp. CCMP2592]
MSVVTGPADEDDRSWSSWSSAFEPLSPEPPPKSGKKVKKKKTKKKKKFSRKHSKARQKSPASGSDSSAIEAKADVLRESDSRKPTVSRDIDLQSASTYTVEAHTVFTAERWDNDSVSERKPAQERVRRSADRVSEGWSPVFSYVLKVCVGAVGALHRVALSARGAETVIADATGNQDRGDREPLRLFPRRCLSCRLQRRDMNGGKYQWRRCSHLCRLPRRLPRLPLLCMCPSSRLLGNRQSWRGGGQQKQQGQWGKRWNQWHRSSQGSNDPRGSGQQSSWTDPDHHNIAEATPSEVAAADARRAAKEAEKDEADDEESYMAALWKSAQDEARADPTRPLSARELAEQGKLQWWWKMPWKTIAEKLPDTHGYKEFLEGMEGPIPASVISRVVTVLAAFRHYGRPLEGDNPVAGVVGPDGHIFRVPGQRILILSCELRGPSYIRNSNSAHSAVMAHGTSFPSLVGVAEIGEIAVNDYRDQGTPCFGFSARGSLVTLSRDALESAATKCASRAKALGGAIVLVECELPRSTPAVEGGNDMMQICCRDAGSVRSGDHFLISPKHAIMRGIAVGWPC